MFQKYLAVALLGAVLVAGAAAAQDSTKSSGEWRGSKLLGIAVYNQGNEKIGDINDIILERSGRVSKVVLGVGGFLGVGEHYVAVGFDKLKWSDQPNASASSAPATNVDSNAPTAADEGVRGTTTGAAAPGNASGRPKATWSPDHAVLNTTRDQLKAMPQFKY